MKKAKNERDQLKQEIIKLEDKLEKAEFESRKLSGTYASNFDSLVNNKNDELTRLKEVVEEQSKLIASYEKMVEKEKSDGLSKTANLSEQVTRLKDDNSDLRTVLNLDSFYSLNKNYRKMNILPRNFMTVKRKSTISEVKSIKHSLLKRKSNINLRRSLGT